MRTIFERMCAQLHIFFLWQDSRFNAEVDQITGYKTQSILCMPIKNHREEVNLSTFFLFHCNISTFWFFKLFVLLHALLKSLSAYIPPSTFDLLHKVWRIGIQPVSPFSVVIFQIALAIFGNVRGSVFSFCKYTSLFNSSCF